MPPSRPLVTGLRLGCPDLRPVVSRIAVPGAGSPRRNSARTTGLNAYFAVPLASLRLVSRRLCTSPQPIALNGAGGCVVPDGVGRLRESRALLLFAQSRRRCSTPASRPQNPVFVRLFTWMAVILMYLATVSLVGSEPPPLLQASVTKAPESKWWTT